MATPTNGQSSTQSVPANNSTHTLIVTASNGTGRYILSATGTTAYRQKEAADVHQPPVMQGSVGPGDRRDVIRYTGHLTSFKQRGELQVTLNGRSVPTAALDGTYINVSTIRNTSTRYRLIATGTIVPAGDAEAADASSTNRSRVMGTISPTDSIDAFYTSGEFVSAAASTNFSLSVNGQAIPISKRNSTPSAMPDGSTASPDSSSTADATGTDAPTRTRDGRTASPPDPTRTATEQASETAQTDSGSGLSLLELVGGIVGMLVVAILGLLFLSKQPAH